MPSQLCVLEFTSSFPRWKGDDEPAFILELCRQFTAFGIQTDVLAPHYNGAKKQEQIDGISVYRYKYFFRKWQMLTNRGGILANLKRNPLNYLLLPFFFMAQMIMLRKLLVSRRYDCLHVHWIIPQGLSVYILKLFSLVPDIPVLCTSHGGDLFILDNILFNSIKRRIMQKMDRVTVVSRYMYEYCRELGVESNKLEVCSMGVDLKQKFVPVLKRQYSYDLLFVGRFVEKKGVSFLLEAVSILKREFHDISLLLVGYGPLKPEYENQIATLGIGGNVHFSGALEQDRLPDVYNSCRIFVLPSIIGKTGDREGLGLVMIEAMGCECPVVAFGHGAIKGVIQENKTGLLANPGDSENLAACIKTLLENEQLARDIAKAARTMALEMFDWSVCAANYSEQLRDIANGVTYRKEGYK